MIVSFVTERTQGTRRGHTVLKRRCCSAVDIVLYTYTNITETIFFQVFSVYYTYIKPTQYLHLTYTISTLNEWVADSWPARRHAPEVLEACS